MPYLIIYTALFTHARWAFSIHALHRTIKSVQCRHALGITNPLEKNHNLLMENSEAEIQPCAEDHQSA